MVEVTYVINITISSEDDAGVQILAAASSMDVRQYLTSTLTAEVKRSGARANVQEQEVATRLLLRAFNDATTSAQTKAEVRRLLRLSE